MVSGTKKEQKQKQKTKKQLISKGKDAAAGTKMKEEARVNLNGRDCCERGFVSVCDHILCMRQLRATSSSPHPHTRFKNFGTLPYNVFS